MTNEDDDTLDYDAEDIVDELQDGMTYQDFADEYGTSASETQQMVSELQEDGYQVAQKGDVFVVEEDKDNSYEWNSDGEYQFAIISDTHLGSEAEQLDSLNEFYDRVEDEGIEVVLHAGDISDGTVQNNGRGQYRGHANHLKPEAIGWQRLEDYVVENFPEREGVNTFFIEGNHDHQLFKNTGKRLGEALDRRRDDLNYLGDSFANLQLDEDIDIDLVHPSGGVPYTLGYRAQTWLRDKPDEEKADITVFGHLHQFLNAETEGSQVLYAGAWQGDSPFLQRQGVKPKAGGWIVDMEAEDGEIRKWGTDRIMYELDSARNDNHEAEQEIQDLLAPEEEEEHEP